MAHSRLIAGFIGPVLLALGVAMLINRDLFPAMVGQLADSYALIFLSGILSLLAGIAIVRVHNVWSGWPVHRARSSAGSPSSVGLRGCGSLSRPRRWLCHSATTRPPC